MTITMVRYTVRPEHAAANEELVREVYAELHETRPDGLRYATFRADDGVGFVHLAVNEADEGPSPLTTVPAFRRFQEGIRERCAEPPVAVELRQVGAFGLFGP
jgi:hypothetical protein